MLDALNEPVFWQIRKKPSHWSTGVGFVQGVQNILNFYIILFGIRGMA